MCLTVLLLGAAPVVWAVDVPGSMQDVISTPEGIRHLLYHTPATVDDLGITLYPHNSVIESFAYSVRDRKKCDLLHYARVEFTTPDALAAVQWYYHLLLGAGVLTETSDAGEITLTNGGAEDSRLVRLTPQPDGPLRVRIERTRQFVPPPRIYTAQEQRVVTILREVANTYTSSPHIRYTMEQQTVPLKNDPKAAPLPVLTWTVDFTRPATLKLSAGVQGTDGLRMSTKDGKLTVWRQLQDADETRPVAGALTIDELPELIEDPLACLMLGVDPIDKFIDFMTILPVPGVAANLQAQIVLTYPDFHLVQYLLLDLPQRRIVQCETVVTHDGEKTRMRRTYTQQSIAPPTPPTKKTVPPAAGSGHGVR